jgi:hypothetical protein
MKVIMFGGVPRVKLSIHNKGYIVSIRRLVYTTFVGQIPKGRYIYHKDGDPNNYNLDNLLVYDKEISEEQKAIYVDKIEKAIHWFCYKHKIRDNNGFDVENFKGEARLQVYLYLSGYDTRRSFTAWAWRYIGYAFKSTMKGFIDKQQHEISIEYIQTKKQKVRVYK